MSLEFRLDGDIFALTDSHRSVRLLCPVNCQAGVMGAGLAKEFARRWPSLVPSHRTAVFTGDLKPGTIRPVLDLPDDRVIFFATKDHWRDPSQLKWVLQGLAALGTYLDRRRSPIVLGIPMLGCGLGGLNWKDVRGGIVFLSRAYPEHRFVVYGPEED